MSQLDERPMILLNSTFFVKHLQFCQRVGNPAVDIYVNMDQQIVIKIQTEKLVYFKNFGCRIVRLDVAQPSRGMVKRPDEHGQEGKVKQQHLRADGEQGNSVLKVQIKAAETTLVKDNHDMESLPYHLMLLRLRQTEEKKTTLAQQPPIELPASDSES